MAITKVRGELVDLNEATSESGLKIPTGTNNNRPATDVAGMVRNNTNETSDGSASCEEYYNGTAWKKLNNIPLPVYYRAVLYTGDSSTQSITGVGFKPDFVWIKERSAAESHRLFDSTRGATKRLFSDNTNAESTATDSLTSFDADGFSLGSSAGINENSQTYVAWCWKANGGTTSSNTDGNITSTVQVNTAAGFSIITYSGTNNGSSATVGTGFDSAVDMVLIKATNSTQAWQVFTNISGVGRLQLNDIGAQDLNNLLTYNSNGTVQFPSQNGSWNESGKNYVAYCFKNIAGFSNFGKYIGDGTTGQAITTVGFEPTWVLIKSTVGSDNWRLFDTTRGITAGGFLEPNTNDAEDTFQAPQIAVTATGFSITSGGVVQGLNASPNLYIYWAFK